MKKISVIVKKKIVYVDYKITSNKNMYLKVTDESNLLVTAPKRIPEKEVQKFVQENIEKFIKYIDKEKTTKLYSLQDNFLFYSGKKFKINHLSGFPKSDIIFKKDNAYIQTKSGTDEESEKAIKDHLEENMKKYLLKRQIYFENKMKTSPHKFRVVYKNSTWGSNNLQKKTISYSSKLSHFSNKVKDYLIVHELAHSIEPNHSSAFYDIVEKYVPDYKIAQKELHNKSKTNEE